MALEHDDFLIALEVGAQEAIDADLEWVESDIELRLAHDLGKRSAYRNLFLRGEVKLDG